jgi:DNA-binding IclR family transcriptional regulator
MVKKGRKPPTGNYNTHEELSRAIITLKNSDETRPNSKPLRLQDIAERTGTCYSSVRRILANLNTDSYINSTLRHKLFKLWPAPPSIK